MSPILELGLILNKHFRHEIRMRGEVSLNVWSDCSTVHKKQTQSLLRPLLSAWETPHFQKQIPLFSPYIGEEATTLLGPKGH